ncbi:rhomboid family intramembrane serine protease [Thiolapillus sp.]
MIIIPFDRKLDWRNPPIVTLVLIIVNILCFFVWQSGDDQRYMQALKYYQDSGLGEIEWSRYREYKGKQAALDAGDETEEDFAAIFHYWQMIEDAPFMHELLAERIISPGGRDYPQWKEKRQYFDELMSRVVFVNWGLRTAAPRWDSLLAHMFLHGGFMHLLGNMIFLLAVGFLVERAIGHGAFLLCYLLVGLGSASFDFLFRPDEFIPSIGASGAIAGLMGMYTVLYWKRRIRFFYFIFVYFDYVSLPAIALLPLWVGNELFQILAYPESNVNYFAHLGGLFSGALVALAVRTLLPSFKEDFLREEDEEAEFEQELSRIRVLCDQLEYRRALPLLVELHSMRPGNRAALLLLQEAARIDPHGDIYHQASQRLLSLPAVNTEEQRLRREVFREYIRHARPGPKLGRKLVCELFEWFIGIGAFREAEFLAKRMARKQWSCERQAEMLYRLADLAAMKGEEGKSELYREAANSM